MGVFMDNEKFELLMNVLNIVEKHNPEDHEIVQCCMDIIDNWDKDMTAEQKSTVLKEFLQFQRKSVLNRSRFADEEYRQQMRNFIGRPDWIF